MINKHTITHALQKIAADTIGNWKTATIRDICQELGIPQTPANSYQISRTLKQMNIRPLTKNSSRYRRYLIPQTISTSLSHPLTPK